MSSQRITLDNPVFAGRLKNYSYDVVRTRSPSIVLPLKGQISDIFFEDVILPKALQEPEVEKLKYQDQQIITNNITPEYLNNSGLQSKNNKRFFTLVMIALAVILFIAGSSVAYLQFRTNKQVEAQVGQLNSSQESSSTSGIVDENPPNETEPRNIGSYISSPDLPRYLYIPELSIHSRVRKLGLKENNELQTPSNIYDTGWYEKSAKPGDIGGAILIDGHVHGLTKPGVFYNLKKLSAGDNIQIERGDGKKFNFKVVKSQTYDNDKVDMASALTSVIPGKLGLNLITCTGQIDNTGNHYEQRLIVFAVAD